MLKLKKFFQTNGYEFIIGLGPLLGVALGGWMTRNSVVSHQIISVTAFGAIFLLLSVLFGRVLTSRYTINSNTLRSVFTKKMYQDILRFADSNSAMKDIQYRLDIESQHAIESAHRDEVLSSEVTSMEQSLLWLRKMDTNSISFVEIMDRRSPSIIIQDLVSNVLSEIGSSTRLKINTSIAEPGCVALVEALRTYGLPIDHEFDDANGMVQAITLSSARTFAASFIPYSTVFLSSQRDRITQQYELVCPVTTEDQQILAPRDQYGRYRLENIVFPERGSGHFQQLGMKASGALAVDEGKSISLNLFKDSSDNFARILFEPIASIALETQRQTGQCGFVTTTPYAVDIVLIVNRKILGNAFDGFRQLVIYAMWQIKSDLIQKGKVKPKLFKRRDVRKAFETANEYFSDILKK